MIRNEKGSAFVIVFFVFILLLTLSLAILSATINWTTRTTQKQHYTNDQQQAFSTINEAINALKVATKTGIFRSNNLLILPPITDYEKFLGEIAPKENTDMLYQIAQTYGVIFQDVTDNTIDKTQYYVRKYVISLAPPVKDSEGNSLYTSNNKYVSTTIYLTPTPSFIKFALGSEGTLQLNGGSRIHGDIYAGNTLITQGNAYYYWNGTQKSVFSAIDPLNSLFIKNKPSIDNNRLYFGYGNTNTTSTNELANSFYPNTSLTTSQPKFTMTYLKDDYLNVNLLKTFKQKLNEAATNRYNLNESTPTLTEIMQQLQNYKDNMTGTYFTPYQTENDLVNRNASKSLWIDGDITFFNQDIIYTNTKTNDKPWIVINGNAFFNTSASTPMTINANFLITGNVYIQNPTSQQGQIYLNTTMYVLGKTEINNTTISSFSGKPECVILSHDSIQIGIMNAFRAPFDNSTTATPKSLNGYFYTDGNARIYAIASYYEINGGLFAAGKTPSSISSNLGESGNLVINTYRGKAVGFDAATGTVTLSPPPGVIGIDDTVILNQSRFIVTSDPTYTILKSQFKGLPLADGIDLIVDKTTTLP